MVGDGVVAAEGWAIGTTKVFLTEEQQQQLEVAREAYLLKVVTQQLQQAIEQREVPVLESAIASAIEVQLQSPLVMQAQQLLTLLQAQLRAVAQLTDAIERRDTSMLDAALLAASQVGLAQHPLVGQAQQLLATLKAQQQATASLADALSRNDASHIATALAECERAGLNTGLMKEAQRRLDTLRRTAELEHHLELATAEDDLGLWDSCLLRQRKSPSIRCLFNVLRRGGRHCRKPSSCRKPSRMPWRRRILPPYEPSSNAQAQCHRRPPNSSGCKPLPSRRWKASRPRLLLAQRRRRRNESERRKRRPQQRGPRLQRAQRLPRPPKKQLRELRPTLKPPRTLMRPMRNSCSKLRQSLLQMPLLPRVAAEASTGR